MIKLKDILSEAYAWERQEGKSLPTLAEVQAAYDAKMQEQSEDDGHEYEDAPEPYNHDDEDDYMDEAAKPDFLDLDHDGDKEESMKSAAADSTSYGNYINKARAKFHLKNKKDDHIYAHDASGNVTKLNNPSDADNAKYKKFTIKSKVHEYGGEDSSLINADMPKNANSDVREKEQVIESFKKRMLGNLHGHEYILREAFKRN